MSDTVADVTDTSFATEVIASSTPVLVDFWAEWCVPCHMVSPVVEEIAREHTADLKVMKLNADDNPKTVSEYKIMSIPTLILFRDGDVKARVTGARGKEAILREIQPHFSA